MGEVQIDEQTRRLSAAITDGVDALKTVLQGLGDRNVEVVDIGLHRPTLDDVFLSLTGHTAEEVSEDGQEAEAERETTREKEPVR